MNDLLALVEAHNAEYERRARWYRVKSRWRVLVGEALGWLAVSLVVMAVW